MTQQQPAIQPQQPNNPAPYGTSQLFGNQPQQPYQPAFNNTQSQAPVNQNAPMQPMQPAAPAPQQPATDNRGVPAWLNRRK